MTRPPPDESIVEKIMRKMEVRSVPDLAQEAREGRGKARLICMPTKDGEPGVPSATTHCMSCLQDVWISLKSIPLLDTGARAICIECLPPEAVAEMEHTTVTPEVLAEVMEYMREKRDAKG